MYIILFLIVLIFAPIESDAQDIKYFHSDQSNKSFDIEQFKKLAAIQKITVLEPHENKTLTYQAISVRSVLTELDSSWKNYEDIQFLCMDGYKPSFSILKFIEEDAYFAFAIEGRREFVIYDRFRQGRKTKLGPIYLIWTSNNPEISATGWAYQIVGIEFISFQNKFAAIIPNNKVSKSVADGFSEFRDRCLPCHSLKSLGGGVGPELHSPVSVTEYFKPIYLKQWILNPASIRENTKMPRLFDNSKHDEAVVESIISYLQWLQ